MKYSVNNKFPVFFLHIITLPVVTIKTDQVANLIKFNNHLLTYRPMRPIDHLPLKHRRPKREMRGNN